MKIRKSINDAENLSFETNKLKVRSKQTLSGISIKNGYITISKQDVYEFIPINSIVHCMSEGCYTWIFLEDGRKLISSKNLGKYAALLLNADLQEKNAFIRIHHRHLININFIVKYNSREKYVEMKNGEKLAIALRRKKDFVTALREKSLW